MTGRGHGRNPILIWEGLVVFIGRDREHLELEEMERVPQHLPTPGDVRVNVNLRLQEFRGSYSNVWLSRPDLEKFVEQLKLLIKTRKTAAKLEAMSPGEFCFELRPYDSLGHFEASVQLGRHQFSGPTYWPTVLSGGFEVDPSELESILAGFRTFLEPRETI
jgi:hypothetical protein